MMLIPWVRKKIYRCKCFKCVGTQWERFRRYNTFIRIIYYRNHGSHWIYNQKFLVYNISLKRAFSIKHFYKNSLSGETYPRKMKLKKLAFSALCKHWETFFASMSVFRFAGFLQSVFSFKLSYVWLR